ncbi:MAG: hypothetical protein WC718_18495 [Phycisphaerales bacterium]|jgi:hypothetical protein
MVESIMYKIDSRYDAEHDVPPGPGVTWADMALYEAVMALATEVDSLRRRVAKLDGRE